MTEKIAHSSGDNKSPSRSHLQEYYERMGDFCDEVFEEAAARQQDVPEIKEMSNTLDYLVGLQWKQDVPSYRAKPVSSEMMANFWETIGLLTDIRPTFHIKDIGTDGGYSQVEKIQNNLAKGWAGTSQFSRKMAFWTMFGMLTTAPVKLYWNPFARGDSGDLSDGDITMEVMPVTSLLRAGVGETYQDDECLIYRRKRTLNWIKRAYPRMGKLVQPEDAISRYSVENQAPVTVMPRLFQNLSPGMKRLVGGSDRQNSPSIYPLAEVREYWMKDDSRNESRDTIWMGPEKAPWGYWVKPGQKMYPRGRLVIRANRVTLYDEPNPYFHRQKPFIPLSLYGVPFQEYAMSVMKPWVSGTDILNQMMAGILQSVKKALNPALMAPRSAINPEALRQIDASKPNLKVSYNSNAATAPTWSNPPNVPAYVFQAYGIVEKAMRRTSSGDAMDQAMGKKQVPGGDTLDRINFSRTTPIRYMGGTVEDALNELGPQWVGNSLQFYDAGRRMELLGAQGLDKSDMDDSPGTLIPHGMDSEAFVRRWQFRTEKGSLLNIQRQDKLQIAFALRKARDLSRKQVFKILDWNVNEKENDAELAEEAKMMAAAQGAGGAPAGKGHK